MQTTITQQIEGIQKARQLIKLVPSHAYTEKVPNIIRETDLAINDAGATLASLKAYVSMYKACSTDEERKTLAVEFFTLLNVLF